MTRSIAIGACMLVLMLGASACKSDAGWARGRQITVHEDRDFVVRRAAQRVDRTSGELLIPWIAARAHDAAPPLTHFALTIYDDRDGDGRIGAGEALDRRESFERARKISFPNVRAPLDARVMVLVQVANETERHELLWRALPE